MAGLPLASYILYFNWVSGAGKTCLAYEKTSWGDFYIGVMFSVQSVFYIRAVTDVVRGSNPQRNKRAPLVAFNNVKHPV